MSTKSALRADLDAEDRKTLAEDRKRMERLGKGSQLDDWLAFGPGLSTALSDEDLVRHQGLALVRN